MTRKLHLSVNYNPGLGLHPARWRIVDDPHQFYDIETYIRIAQIAEAAAFDMVFLSDGPALIDIPPVAPWQVLEPTVALSAMAMQTERIGLVATASTTYNHPYNLARRFASLDHISRGRIGWNIVTSYTPNVAANFGGEIPDHDTRYGRAEEFLELALALWDSWEEGALVVDQETGQFVDPAGIHQVNHKGENFDVRGPLQVPRSPQGHPVFVQAGASEQGLNFGTKYADVIFSIRPTFEAGQRAYEEVKRRVRAHGRRPEDLVLLAGIYPVVGSTEREAYEHRAQLDELIDLEVELDKLSERLRFKLTPSDLDRPVPKRPTDDNYVAASSHGLRDQAWQALEASSDLTLRELLLRHGAAIRHLVGTPEQIADDLEHWFRDGAADGFNVSATHFPEGLERFAEHVIPELRRRGLFREEYEGTTLREHLGIDVPANRHTAAVPSVV